MRRDRGADGEGGDASYVFRVLRQRPKLLAVVAGGGAAVSLPYLTILISSSGGAVLGFNYDTLLVGLARIAKIATI